MARPKSKGETKSHQQHLLMAPSEVAAIDDWMFKNRLKSRGEAIRRLCQIGLALDAREAELEGLIVSGAIDMADRYMSASERLDEGSPAANLDPLLDIAEIGIDAIKSAMEMSAVVMEILQIRDKYAYSKTFEEAQKRTESRDEILENLFDWLQEAREEQARNTTE